MSGSGRGAGDDLPAALPARAPAQEAAAQAASALSAEERQRVLDTLHSERFGDRSPEHVWATQVRLSRPGGFEEFYGHYGGAATDSRGSLHVAWAEGTARFGTPEARGGIWYAKWDGRVPR